MNLLTRALLRALRRAPGSLAGVVGLVAVAVTVYAGTAMGLHRIDGTTARLYEDLRLFDLEIRVVPLPSPPPITAAGVAAARWRLLAPARLAVGERWAVAALASAPAAARPAVCDVLLTAGEYLSPQDPTGVVIDTTFAADLGLAVGDPIAAELSGLQLDLRIRGIGVFPEFLMGSADDSLYMPIRETLAAVLVSEDLIRGLLGYVPANSLALTLEPGADREAARAAVEAELRAAGVQVQSALWPEDQFSVWCNWNRLEGFRDFLPTVMAVFVGLTLLALLLLLRRMTAAWRGEMGALLAGGAAPGALYRAWTAAVAALVGLGALAGLGGALLLSRAVTAAYVEGTGFPVLLTPPSLAPALLAGGLCLLVVPPAVYLPLRALLAAGPAALLRPSPDTAAPLPILRMLRRIEAGLPPLPWPERLGLRGALRRPEVFAVSAACVGGMLVTAVSMYLFAQALDEGLEEYLDARRWEHLAELGAPVPDADAAALCAAAGAERCEPLLVRPGTIQGAGGQRGQELVGLPIPSELQGGGGIVYGRWLERRGEIVVNLRLAQALGVEPGQVVEAAAGGAPRPLTVVGIVNNYTVNQAFLAREDLAALSGERGVSALMLAGADEAALHARPEIAAVLPGEKLEESARAVNRVLVSFLRLYGHLAAAAGALLIGAVHSLNLAERASEHALLRAGGASGRELTRAFLAESLMVGLAAALGSLAPTWLTLWIFQQRIQRISIWVPLDLGLGAWAAMVAPVVLLIALTALPAARWALRQDPAVALRSRLGG